MEENRPRRSRPEMGTPEYEEWRKCMLERRRKRLQRERRNRLIAIGAAVLEDEEYFQETIKKIIDTREWFKEEMRNLGFSFADSKSNFLFVTHETAEAKDIFEAAKKEDIFVRYFDKPSINHYLRITIGTREEMESFLKFVKDFLTK